MELYRRSRSSGVEPIACTLTPTFLDALNREITEVNRMLRRRCWRRQTPLADLYSAVADDRGHLSPRFSSDGVHLNRVGYRTIARVLYEEVVRALLISREP